MINVIEVINREQGKIHMKRERRLIAAFNEGREVMVDINDARHLQPKPLFIRVYGVFLWEMMYIVIRR